MSFPVYPEYKEVGFVGLDKAPKHWELTPLKYLALLNPKKSGFSGETDKLCSFLPMEKLKTGTLKLDDERSIDEVFGGYTYFEEGDVLQAKVTPCFENKNIAVAKGLKNGVGFGSSEINVLRPLSGVDTNYLFYRLQENNYMSFCTGSMIGAGGLRRVPGELINNFKVAAPTLPEQIQIARFLDHETARIDALIEEQKRLIELLKEKRQAVISHTVTKGLDPNARMKDSGVEWLGEVPEHWRKIRLKHVLDDIIDTEHKTAPSYDDGEYMIARTSNVRDGKLILAGAKYTDYAGFLEWTKRGVPTPGDILFTREAPAGEACIVPNGLDLCLGQRMVLFKLKNERVSSEFVVHSLYGGLSEEFVKSLSQGSTVAHFNMGDIGNIPLFEPPLSEQKKIAEYIHQQLLSFDSLVEEADRSVVLMRERRSALISAAVTGKIDVCNWQPGHSSATDTGDDYAMAAEPTAEYR